MLNVRDSLISKNRKDKPKRGKELKKQLLRPRLVVFKRKKNSKDKGMRLNKKLRELGREWRRKLRNRENDMKQKLSKSDFV